MGMEHRSPDERLLAAVTAVREAVELLETLWMRRPGAASISTLSSPQLRALYVLERQDGINLRRLSTEVGAAPSSVSRLCDRLEALGFMRRTSSPVSRRELELQLTSHGGSHLEQLRGAREEQLSAIMAGMTPSARTALVQGLEGFGRALAAAAADPVPERTADGGARRSA